ncbi:Acetyl-CoA acetyltransferase [Seminavis robusta]|uniref:Acetyl-CoA acetyltransferase n=1 Tax=Seminavis robusta TaxID=568900 RepID=A0A9N8DWA6_9STRA|nr:Acetyl-CoA acetyltransferase [Seminavis robusta]|eukprot:Sro343_g121940.1 Acetyl-CoA acetyltransferase (406) ;mRNA; r:18622-20029
MSLAAAGTKTGGVFLVAAKRTPFGSFGGSLKSITPTELGVISSKAALAGLDPLLVDTVYFGNINPSSKDAAYLARHVALQSGCAQSTPALTLNRACGSGFEAVIQGYNAIRLGQAQVALCGGSENMSMAPLQICGNDARWGVPLGKGLTVRDGLWAGLQDDYVQLSMGMTAEKLAEKYGITREQCDAFALRSQQNWKAAHDQGLFEAEMAPVELPNKKGTTTLLTTDEHPRPDVTLEKLAKLRPVFQKDGVVTAANASGICDGAGAIVVASEEAVQQHNLQPLARIVSYGITGCDPTIMGIGPVSAIRQALARADTSLDQVDRVEINEAFAAQFLACATELGVDMDKANLHGGAISLGHPTGASGARIIAHLAHEFHQEGSKAKLSIGSACIGGGQGIAVLLEKA